MSQNAPLPDLPPLPVSGMVGDGRPITIALCLVLLGGTLAHWHLDSPRTLGEIMGASVALGGIAEAMVLRLGFSGTRAAEGIEALKRFPMLKAAPWHIRMAFVMIAWGLSLKADGQAWQLAPDLLGVLTAAWLMPELVRCLDAAYCRILRRVGIIRRPIPPLPIALVQAVALIQAAIGVVLVIVRS